MRYNKQERRRNTRLVDYWDSLRGERIFPCETAIDPVILEDIWANCYLLQVRDIEQVDDYNFTYLGGAIHEAYLAGTLDECNEHVISPNARKLSGSFQQVIETKQPLVKDGSFIALDGKEVLYRQSMLPVGQSDTKVEAIFGGMFFKKA